MSIAIPTIRARIDPIEALAKAEARMRSANVIPNLHRAAKAMDVACASVLAISPKTQADIDAQTRANDWTKNRNRRVSDAIQRLGDMDTIESVGSRLTGHMRGRRHDP